MQRLSQVSLHLSHNTRDGVIETKSSSTPPFPPDADRGQPSTTRTNTNMAKTKVVVTRQLIDEAQRLLDAKKEDLEVVQWQSEKVRVHHWR
jgi:glyoxylate/hydroxypyruvate reductase